MSIALTELNSLIMQEWHTWNEECLKQGMRRYLAYRETLTNEYLSLNSCERNWFFKHNLKFDPPSCWFKINDGRIFDLKRRRSQYL